MFCPQCGSNQSDDVKFCKSCGGNLFAVRQAVAIRETTHDTGGKFDWGKTWVAEMMLSGSEREKRKEELERQRGIAPGSTQSHKEIKAGVITASVGVGLAVFLYVLMEGIIMGGNIGANAAPILSRLWIAGVIPFVVGLGLLINGLFVRSSGQAPAKPGAFENESQPMSLTPRDSSEFTPSPSSVTEHTTRQLRDSDQRQS
ncbi:MAG: hypothetical protein AABO41_00545 [Acidobacteriota bacterium]